MKFSDTLLHAVFYTGVLICDRSNQGSPGGLVIMLLILFQVENELKTICGDILDALERHLLPSAVMGESKVFYNKM